MPSPAGAVYHGVDPVDLFDEHFDSLKKIYDYFGYAEDWVVLPLDDARSYFWLIDRGSVRYAKTMEELKNGEGNCFSDEIYTQRNTGRTVLPSTIYQTEAYTLIAVDTHVDGNKFLRIFDNRKRVRMCQEFEL